jgi:pimeloyl-[acyl-carrier protein] methyl ester esterase
LGRFKVSDGAWLAFDDEGQGRTLVFLHGLMAHRGFFARQSELARDFRLVSIDLRGHGQSRGGTHPVTLRRMAEDVAELVEALGIAGAIGIGWSLGASVLWHLLDGASSSRFAGAVIVDMTPCVLNDDDWTLGLTEAHCAARSEAIRQDFESFAQAAGAAIFTDPEGEDRAALRSWAGQEFARNDPEAIGATWQSLVDEDFRSILAGIRQPTLVVHGANSHLYGSDTADHLVAALPNARGVMFERSGHSPHIEQPELFNRTIREFADSLNCVRATQQTN